MAGTIPLSMTQQFDIYGKPLAGGLLYIMQVGTVSTPQNAYQDTGLTIAHTYPMVLDAAGRVPQFFLADGSVKIRLQDASGVVQLASDSVLVIGASSGGGGGSTVDPTALIQTGMMMFAHTTSAIAGFVRLNDRTIGSATSGASERANSDTNALFLYLWPDATLTVSGSRGASAAADWTANKTIKLPDWRGYGLGALDDMGNTAAGRLTSTYFGTSAIVLGAVGGQESRTLTLSQIPTGITVANASQSISVTSTIGNIVRGTTTTTFVAPGAVQVTLGNATDYSSGSVSSTGTNSISATSNNTSGQAHAAIGPRKLITFFMKL